MSVDYYAICVVGLDVSGKLEKKIQVPSCTHPNEKNAKFCSSCGVKIGMRTETESAIPGLDRWDDEFEGYNIIRQGDGSEVAFIGTSVECDGGKVKGVDISQLEEMRVDLRDLLTPHGLWDESKFGVFVMMRWS